MSADSGTAETDRSDGRVVDLVVVTADKKASLSAPILRVEKVRDELAVPSEEESVSQVSYLHDTPAYYYSNRVSVYLQSKSLI